MNENITIGKNKPIINGIAENKSVINGIGESKSVINGIAENKSTINEIVKNKKTYIIKPNGERIENNNFFLCEHTLVLKINGKKEFKISCTKDKLYELAIGRLFLEGWLKSEEDIIDIKIHKSCKNSEYEDNINTSSTLFDLKLGNKEKKPLTLKKIRETNWEKEWIFNLAKKFSDGMPLHKKTQGLHSCFLANENELIFSCEDISRHNAIDKTIGFSILNHIDLSKQIMYTSGRVPIDVCKKVILAGIPLLVSKAIATNDAIKLSKEYGLNLIYKAYPDQFQIS